MSDFDDSGFSVHPRSRPLHLAPGRQGKQASHETFGFCSVGAAAPRWTTGNSGMQGFKQLCLQLHQRAAGNCQKNQKSKRKTHRDLLENCCGIASDAIKLCCSGRRRKRVVAQNL